MFDGDDPGCSSFLAIRMAIEFADIPKTESDHLFYRALMSGYFYVLSL